MMNEEMLRNIDSLRERADATYEEAIELLERNGGDLGRALVELEHQGRIHAATGAAQGEQRQQCRDDARQAKQKAASFWQKACRTRLVVERDGKEGEKETIVNLSAPFAVGVTVIAPYVTLASAALTLATGCQVKVRKVEDASFL